MQNKLIKSNLFENIPESLEQEAFEELLQNDSIKIERIISKGHSSPEHGWYDQERHEWVLILKGKGILLFDDDSEITLQPGDSLHIPAHTRHKVIWTDPDTETIWLAVHYE